MIDGYVVEKGDKVWVMGHGYCQVITKANDGSFTVKTGKGRLNFSRGGYSNTVKKVFWHNPCFFNPPKTGALWAAFISVASPLLRSIMSLYNQGYIEDEEDSEDVE